MDLVPVARLPAPIKRGRKTLPWASSAMGHAVCLLKLVGNLREALGAEGPASFIEEGSAVRTFILPTSIHFE